MNTNTDTAVLQSDDFNGTQPEHAGIYICYANGVPRRTVEVVVLGKSRLTLYVKSGIMNLLSLCICVVPAESSSVSEAFFRFTSSELFGDQVIVSNCIQALEVLVRQRILLSYFLLCNLYSTTRPLIQLVKVCQEYRSPSAAKDISK